MALKDIIFFSMGKMKRFYAINVEKRNNNLNKIERGRYSVTFILLHIQCSLAVNKVELK